MQPSKRRAAGSKRPRSLAKQQDATRSNTADLNRHYACLKRLIADDALTGLDVGLALETASAMCRQGLAADRVSIWLKDGSGQQLEMLAASGDTTTIWPRSVLLSPGESDLLLSVVARGDVVASNDAHQAPHLQQLFRLNPGLAATKSRLDVPIVIDGAVWGIIIVSMVSRRVSWNVPAIAFAREVATLVALGAERRARHLSEQQLMALTNNLMSEIDRREERDKTLEDHQRVLTNLLRAELVTAQNDSEALQTLTETVRTTLGLDRLSIWIDEASARSSQVVAASGSGSASTLPKGTAVVLPEAPIYLAALRRSEPLVTTDPLNAPHLAELIEAFPIIRETKARIDVPIMHDGNLIGALIGISLSSSRNWSSEDTMFLTAVTGVASVLLERRQRLLAEQARNEEARLRDNARLLLERNQNSLRSILQASREDSVSLATALPALAASIRDTLDVDRISVWLADEDGTTFRLRAAGERDTTVLARVGTTFRTDEAPDYTAIMNCGEPVSTRDCANAPHLAELRQLFSTVAQSRLRIDVPIVRNGRLAGVIIASHASERTWSVEDLMFMSAVSGIAAMLLERHQRREVESDLRRANQEARAANDAKSIFLANMSHEIRTPMNGVFGMTDLLLRTDLTERQARFVQTINQSARTLLTIINDILDLSRIEAGKLELDSHDVDLHQVVEGAVELFIEDARKKGLDLSVFVAPDVPKSLIGDSGRLRQICLNIIGNAVKFTHEGRVAVRVMVEDKTAEAPKIVIEVRDTGIGIAPEMQARLFQPFTQADSSITRRFGGTGLGLSISMHLAEQMGGRVRLASAPGEGTVVRFHVNLPVGLGQPEVLPASLAGKRILVVDDQEVNRDIVSSYLSSCGAVCDHASNGIEAAQRAARANETGQPFDVVVVDMNMPGIDGLEVVQRLRADPRNSTTGVVMVSSMSWKGDQRSIRQCGIHTMLTKPVRRVDLVAAVVEALGQSANRLASATLPVSQPSALVGRVLLAEDNPVNVEVAREYLISAGLTVTVARDGAEALRLLQTSADFDLVLMDCQMPNLDGLEATRRLRAWENKQVREPMPVVAITANAYDADRIACFDAGMDDYLSKPFTQEALLASLKRWLARKPRPTPLPEPARVQDETLVASVLDEMQDRPQMVRRVRAAFLTHTPHLIAELTEAAVTGNVAALLGAAHSLKSSSATIGAKRLSRLCAALEQAARERHADDAVVRVRDIAAEFRSVGNAIEAEWKKASAR